MVEFLKTVKKDSKVQNEISQTIEKYNKESNLRNQKQDKMLQSKVKSLNMQ